jgi:glycosyltransferase involved in cell wall biosynthesis
MIHEFGDEDHDLQFLFGHRRTSNLIVKWSKTVLCCSVAVERHVLLNNPHASTTVVYQAVESPSIPPRARADDEPLQAILVGRLAESKGQMLALEAVACALARGVEIHLDLVGPGDPQTLRRHADRLGVSSLVEFHPATADLAPHWMKAHVALMCSRSEAFGRVTVEAMKAGLPVCGVGSGGTPELVVTGINGLMSPPDDASALATNLLALHTDERLRWRLAEGAHRCTARFSLERYGADLIDALSL